MNLKSLYQLAPELESTEIEMSQVCPLRISHPPSDHGFPGEVEMPWVPQMEQSLSLAPPDEPTFSHCVEPLEKVLIICAEVAEITTMMMMVQFQCVNFAAHNSNQPTRRIHIFETQEKTEHGLGSA